MQIPVILWLVHYSKRIFESAFIHTFSADTMPLVNVFKNSGYYWGASFILGYLYKLVAETAVSESAVSESAVSELVVYKILDWCLVIAWICCQIGNGWCHYYLANLRTSNSSREHILPSNRLFQYICSPNYGFEILGWFLFGLIGSTNNILSIYFAAKMIFCLFGAGQMYIWAQGKRQNRSL